MRPYRVGGPLREIAAFTGADVTGLNNNAFQVQRGTQINKKTGRHDNCDFIKADFMNIPRPVRRRRCKLTTSA